MKTITHLLCIVTAAGFVTCSRQTAGAGSETTNGIVGSVKFTTTDSVKNAIVRLFPEDYDPVADKGLEPIIDTTDTSGTYRFRNLKSGAYTILAHNETRSSGLLLRDIEVFEDSITVLPENVLAATGSIAASFTESNMPKPGSYLYLPGTDIYTHVSEGAAAALQNIPPGTFSAVIFVSPEGDKKNLLKSDITLAEQAHLILMYPEWNYRKDIALNTTPSGAGVTGDVYHFPLLIRLNESNFTFSQAATDGSDLRFTENSKQLLFEIERYDAAERRAEIWVTIDTLRGNSESQTISMFWGNSVATSPKSSESTVFDTSYGFQGIWHLGDAVADSIRDASPNHLHGISPDTGKSVPVEGLIGKCHSFNGTSSFITMPNSASSALNFPLESSYSVSAWVYVENVDTKSHVIICKGNMQYFLWYTSIHIEKTLWEFADFRSDKGWDLSVSPVSKTTGTWVHLTGVRDGNMQRLYVNGELSDTLFNYTFSGQRNGLSDLMFGRYTQIMASPNNDEGFCYFKGDIDEVRICSNALSADWIKLCYMNQKLNDQLVTFK